MKLSVFLIAFLFAPLTVEAQYQIINPTVNQEDDDDYKKDKECKLSGLGCSNSSRCNDSRCNLYIVNDEATSCTTSSRCLIASVC